MRGFACSVQEDWRLGKNEVEHNGCVYIHTGPDKKLCNRGSLGVGILLSKAAVQAWTDAGNQVLRFGLRVIATRLHVTDPKGVLVIIFMVSAYAPDSGKPQAEKDDFYQCLQKCFDARNSKDILVLGIDANASPGKRSRHDDPQQPGRDQVRGPFGMSHENEAGRVLCTFLAINGMCLTSTYFRKRNYASWKHPGSGKWHHLDHIIVEQKQLKRVRNAGVVGLRGKNSDHFAVSAHMSVRAKLKKQTGPKKVRIDRRLLNDPVGRDNFLGQLKKEMIKPNAGNKVQQLEDALRAAASITLATKGKPQPGWYEAAADAINLTITARNEAQLQHDRHDTDQTKQRLREARKVVKRAVRAAEAAWIQQQMDYIQGLDKSLHPAAAWKAIIQLRDGKSVTKPVAKMVLNDPATGKVAKDQAESAEIMAKYLESTFSKEGKFDAEALKKIVQRDPQVFAWMGEEPTDKEIRKAIAKAGSNKSGSDAECPAEYYKAMEHDEETRMYIRQIISEFWKSGSYRPPPLPEPPPEPPPVQEPDVRSSRVRKPSQRQRIALEHRPLPKSKPKVPASVPEVVPELPDRDEDADRDGVMYPEWLVARLKLLPKKGNLAECKNWRGICLLDIASKIVSSIAVDRMQKVLEAIGMESQSGFTSKRGNRDGTFNVSVALQKRKEHGLATWVLFVDLVKAFDTVVREALFAVMRKFGMPDHFINILIRLHEGASIKVTIGDVEKEIASTIGVRQGSCEGPSLFLFIIQAALETMDDWPAAKPQFFTRSSETDGEITGAKSERKRGVTAFELWSSLFADDCALFFDTREDLIKGTNYLFHHLQRFGLLMHIGKGVLFGPNLAHSKTEAVYFPPQGKPHADGDQSNFKVASGFVSFTDEFRYLGSIIHNSLKSDTDVNARITKATAAFGALQKCFFSSRLATNKDKGIVFAALCLSVLLYGSECWCLRADLRQRLRVFFNQCVRRMCRVTMHHTMRHKITTKSLLKRLNLHSFDQYYNSRLLRWAGHVVRMPMHRTPRMLLTGWVRHPRPSPPEMTIGRTINNALKSKGISTNFQTWRELAQDRPAWRAQTHPAAPREAV